MLPVYVILLYPPFRKGEKHFDKSFDKLRTGLRAKGLVSPCVPILFFGKDEAVLLSSSTYEHAEFASSAKGGLAMT